jgi:hypothetical protein
VRAAGKPGNLSIATFNSAAPTTRVSRTDKIGDTELQWGIGQPLAKSDLLKLKRSKQMKSSIRRHAKDETVLFSMGESIGSTLGAIAGRAHAVQKALTVSRVSRTVKRDGRKLVKKSKTAGPKTSRRGSSRAA